MRETVPSSVQNRAFLDDRLGEPGPCERIKPPQLGRESRLRVRQEMDPGRTRKACRWLLGRPR